MIPSELVAATLLSLTMTETLPSLTDLYCRSESVVYAVATVADPQCDSEGTQMNGTEFRVVTISKGFLETGQLVYVIDRQFYSVGAEYLLFLRQPEQVELSTHKTRPTTYEPSKATRVVTGLGVAIPVKLGVVEIDTEYIGPDGWLLAAEEVLALRKTHKPFRVRRSTLDGAFRRMSTKCAVARRAA